MSKEFDKVIRKESRTIVIHIVTKSDTISVRIFLVISSPSSRLLVLKVHIFDKSIKILLEK
jgi:hypothetical protein